MNYLIDFETEEMGEIIAAKINDETYLPNPFYDKIVEITAGKNVVYTNDISRLYLYCVSSGMTVKNKKESENELKSRSFHRFDIGNTQVRSLGDWGISSWAELEDKIEKGMKFSYTPRIDSVFRLRKHMTPDDIASVKFQWPSFSALFMTSNNLNTKFISGGRGGWIGCKTLGQKKLFGNVVKVDVKSQYPYIFCNKLIPISKGMEVDTDYIQIVKKMIIVSGKEILKDERHGFIGWFKFHNARLKDSAPASLFQSFQNGMKNTMENQFGITDMEELNIVLNRVDYEMFCEMYDWDAVTVKMWESHVLGYAPKSIVSFIDEAFEKKNTTEGFERALNKLALNSIIGMFGTDPFKQFMDKNPSIDELKDAHQKYKHNHMFGQRIWDKRWLSYVQSYGRRMLLDAMNIIIEHGGIVAYWDTDGIFYVDNADSREEILTELNDGKTPNTMGFWEEEVYKYFMYLVSKRWFGIKEDGSYDVSFAGAILDKSVKIDPYFLKKIEKGEITEIPTLETTTEKVVYGYGEMQIVYRKTSQII